MKFICILSIILFFVLSSLSIEEILDSDKMYILIGEKIFPINLIENKITEELISILPLKTKIIEENDKTLHMKLSITIETSNYISLEDTLIKGKKGDLFLFKGNEIILLNEQKTFINENKDYIKIGYIEDIANLLSTMRINKSIFLWNTLNYENHKGKVKPYAYYTNLMNYFTWKLFTFFCFFLL